MYTFITCNSIQSSCLSFKNGLLIGLNKKKLDINDKFFIAGPTSLRGFKHNSIGPKDNSKFIIFHDDILKTIILVDHYSTI